MQNNIALKFRFYAIAKANGRRKGVCITVPQVPLFSNRAELKTSCDWRWQPNAKHLVLQPEYPCRCKLVTCNPDSNTMDLPLKLRASALQSHLPLLEVKAAVSWCSIWSHKRRFRPWRNTCQILPAFPLRENLLLPQVKTVKRNSGTYANVSAPLQ
jgi:hypothetical protein